MMFRQQLLHCVCCTANYMTDLSVTGSSVHCATDRLKVTNDYKKTDRVGQIVSNVSESIKSVDDGSIFFLGPRSVEEVWGSWDTLVSMEVL